MDLELRAVTEEEFPVYAAAVAAAFGEFLADDDVDRYRSTSELDRTIGVFDDGDIVATTGAFSFDLTLPGATRVPAAGVTAVGVRPTHRRRGLLRRMMDHQLDDVAARGEALAVLTASESVIYGRFGYGSASSALHWKIRTAHAALAPSPPAGGRLQMLGADRAREVLPAVYERAAVRAPGAVSRRAEWWDAWIADPVSERGGASARFYAVHESPTGEANGYVAWRRKGGDAYGLPEGELLIDELVACHDEVEAELFQLVLSVDLVATVTAAHRPIDEPLRWRLRDPRQLEATAVLDDLWVRVLDPAAALAARRYGTEDALVLDLVDRFRPANEGRWRVEGGVDGALCDRSRTSADLTLSIADLGAIYLGGVAPSVLARAGRIREERRGALRRADAFFAAEAAPWLTTRF